MKTSIRTHEGGVALVTGAGQLHAAPLFGVGHCSQHCVPALSDKDICGFDQIEPSRGKSAFE